MTRLSVVVVGYGAEPDLSACLAAIRADLAPGDELVLVDNGITSTPDVHGARIVKAPRNDGFAAGCHLGVAATRGDVLVFVNSDAVLQRGTLAAFRAAAMAPEVGLVTGLVVLAGAEHIVNAAGNPVHYLGISWAGGFGEDVRLHREARDVASISGALFGTRRDVWEQLGGLDPSYFLYHEDADLSLRCWLAGLRVTYCPDAVARHTYAFGKHEQKMYLLERNRLVTVLSTYPTPLLLRVLPMQLLTEPLLLAMAMRQGWGWAKVRSWIWAVGHTRSILRRRRLLQGPGSVPWQQFAAQLEPRIRQTVTATPPAMRGINWALGAYWQFITREVHGVAGAAHGAAARRAA